MQKSTAERPLHSCSRHPTINAFLFPYSIFKMCADGEDTPQVGLTRLELVTSPLSGVRSNRLSYRPSLIPLSR